jgi:hypothetical protein
MKLHSLYHLALACAAAVAGSAAHAQPSGVPLMKPPIGAASVAGAKPAAALPGQPTTIAWDALVPASWDPFKDFKDLNFQAMDDGDPRAAEMMKRMREVWDNAPVNNAIVGKTVRIPGFVVPLEDTKDGLKEFLLVPYFGACIHSPPPPSNQIVHVRPLTAAKGVRSMDAVWITGTLATVRTDSYMGAASYRIEATSVAPYKETAR